MSLEIPFTIDSIVILPDHLNCIWRLPANDIDYSTRRKKIKTHFTDPSGDFSNGIKVLYAYHESLLEHGTLLVELASTSP